MSPLTELDRAAAKARAACAAWATEQAQLHAGDVRHTVTSWREASGEVSSLYADYLSALRALELARAGAAGEEPAPTCEGCGEPLDFDGDANGVCRPCDADAREYDADREYDFCQAVGR